MKKKWGIVVAILVIAVLVIAIICTVMKGGWWTEKNGESINSGEQIVDNIVDEPDQIANISVTGKITEEKLTVGDLDIKELSVEFNEGYTFVKGSVVNNSSIDYPVGVPMEITLYRDGTELIRFPVLTSSLRANGNNTFESQLTIDCSSATDIRVEIVGD